MLLGSSLRHSLDTKKDIDAISKIVDDISIEMSMAKTVSLCSLTAKTLLQNKTEVSIAASDVSEIPR